MRARHVAAKIIVRFGLPGLLVALTACDSANNTPGSSALELSPKTTEPLSSAALLSVSCSGCHRPESTAIPPIDQSDADTLYAALLTYKIDETDMTVMHRLMRGYSDAELRTIADHLGMQDE